MATVPNGKCPEWQVSQMASRSNGNSPEWQVSRMATVAWQVSRMASVRMASECQPPREDGTNGTVHCQLHCPKQCNWLNEQTCWGGLDPNGCPEPDYCTPFGYEKPDEDGTNFFCPNYCSPMCSMDELWCQSGEDENGCWGPEYCMPQTTFGPNGQECPAFCPLICSNGSTYVPEPDDANGCPTQGFCEYM